jgi:elongation factor Ts
VEAERDFATKKARDEGKPEHVLDRIVDGRLNTFYGEQVLLDQPFVKDDKRTVAQVLDEYQRTSGEKIAVGRFARFRVGE